LNKRSDNHRPFFGVDDFGRDDSLFGASLVTHRACHVAVKFLLFLGLGAQNILLAFDEGSGKILVHGFEHW